MALVESQIKPFGWEAPNFELKATDESLYTLHNFKDLRATLIFFTCNHCPYAVASWPLIIDLYKRYYEQVNFVAINPNDAETYPNDSFDNMKKLVEEMGVQFPYLYDENQEVAKAYDAQCTPDLYLFKNDNNVLKLFYHGRINDNRQDTEKVSEKNLEDAIELLLNDEKAPTNQPPSMGCSIKWKS